MRRLRLAALLSLLVLVLLATRLTAPAPVTAYESWCADDPLLVVAGRLVDIQVQLPLTALAIKRTTTLTVVIPRNTSGVVLVDDVSAFPMVTTVESSGPQWSGQGAVPITVVAMVSAVADVPLRVVATTRALDLTPLGQQAIATGTTNVKATVPVALPVPLGFTDKEGAGLPPTGGVWRRWPLGR